MLGCKHRTAEDYRTWVEGHTSGPNVIDGRHTYPYSADEVHRWIDGAIYPLVIAKDPVAWVCSYRRFNHATAPWEDVLHCVPVWCESYSNRYRQWLSLVIERNGVAIWYEALTQTLSTVLGEIADRYSLTRLPKAFVPQPLRVYPGCQTRGDVFAGSTEEKPPPRSVVELVKKNIDWAVFESMNCGAAHV